MIKRQWFVAGEYKNAEGKEHDFSGIVSTRRFFSNASVAKKELIDRLKKDGVEEESIFIRSMNRV